MRLTRSQLAQPSKAGPRYNRRRSTCLIPPATNGPLANLMGSDPGKLRYDPLGGLPVLPKPVKLGHVRPSLKKFHNGKSSLYSVAYALKQNASAARAVTARREQALLWCHVDQKEIVTQLNAQRQNRPALPSDLAVKIRIARCSVAHLLHQGFAGFQVSSQPFLL